MVECIIGMVTIEYEIHTHTNTCILLYMHIHIYVIYVHTYLYINYLLVKVLCKDISIYFHFSLLEQLISNFPLCNYASVLNF